MKLAVLCAVVAALAAAQDTAQVTGTIEGVVVNKVTGAGIGGAPAYGWNKVPPLQFT